VKTLNSLLLHMQSQGGGKPDDLVALHRLRADAGARVYATKKQANEDDKDLLAGVRASFRLLEDKGKLEAPMLQLWATTEEWAGAGAEAVNVWLRRLQRAADDATVFDPIVDTAARTGQLPLAIEALRKRTDATAIWYLGKARYLLADAQRKGGKTPDALATLDQAFADFGSSMGKNATFKDSCEQWQALVLGKKGTIAYYDNDTANAQKWLIEAAQKRPDRLADDLGDGDSIKRSILFLVDKFLKKNDLAKVEQISRQAADAASGDIDMLNNAGLFARNHGNALEQAGKTKEAGAMYEQSYKAYRKAAQLDPTNVRLRNDCALIAIYHLERDWDLAKDMLDGAIADGQKTLQDSPPADANDREKLDEAIGDAYENLALWHLKHSKDAKAAKATAEASLKHFPGQRRGGARAHLAAAERLLQGK
jgi:tetratricopeptide (TPR) repeat protein